MSTIILDCPKCQSRNISDLNPEIRKTTDISLISGLGCSVDVTAKCNQCGFIFKYATDTDYGEEQRKQGKLL